VLTFTVTNVADDGVSDVLEVLADLMGAPSFGDGFDQPIAQEVA
jgi:hypothetical protein